MRTTAERFDDLLAGSQQGAAGIDPGAGSGRSHMTQVGGVETERRLRFGIVLDAPAIDAWKAATLDQLQRSGVADLALVVIVGGNRDGRPRRPRPAPGSSLGEKLGYAALHAYATYVSRSVALGPFEGAAWNADVASIRVSRTPTKSPGITFRADDLEKIREHRLDFLLWLHPGAPAGDLLEIASNGVWTFRLGDEGLYTGQPAGFWELVDGQPVIRAALERATLPGDGAPVLREGWFAIAPESYARTRDRFHLGMAGWPAQVCREILLGGAAVPRPSSVAPVARRAINLRWFGRLLVVITRARHE